MSGTRRADPDDPVSFEKYMSSPQYTERRGIDGSAVTAKAVTEPDPHKRGLLFFIQALSHRLGGLPLLAQELVAAFRDRLGTDYMRQIATKPGQKYSAAQAKEVLMDFNVLDCDAKRLFSDWDIREPWAEPTQDQRNSDYALNLCAMRAVETLPGLLTEICINPEFEIRGKAFRLDYFAEAFAALGEFRKQFEQKALNGLAETEVAGLVTKTLDRALKHRRMVVLEGEPGIGKTKAAKAWCDAHLGEARFVSLHGAVNKTSIFRSIGRALGVATGLNRKAADMQGRIEDMLDRSKIMLLIDESHFLFGQAHERVRSRPEMIDWIDTALCNQGVPVALVATPQFTTRLHQVERQTQWQSTQFRRRIKDYVRLPAKNPPADVEAVARIMFPACDRAAIKLATGRALLSPYPLSWLEHLLEDAQEIAAAAGRESPQYEDLERAINETRTPSDLAQAQAFDPSKHLTKRGRPMKAARPEVRTAGDSAEAPARFEMAL